MFVGEPPAHVHIRGVGPTNLTFRQMRWAALLAAAALLALSCQASSSQLELGQLLPAVLLAQLQFNSC